MLENGPDLLRLLAIPIFGYAAWTDYNIRRVDNRIWSKLIVIGILAFTWQIHQISPIHTAEEFMILRESLITASIFAAGSVILFNSGALGGADAKAIFSLGLLFPVNITIGIPAISAQTLPIFSNPLAATGVTIIMNSFVFATFYLVIMWKRNIDNGVRSLSLLTAAHRDRSSVEQIAGKLVGKTKSGDRFVIDLDTLRMYLRWRGTSINEIIENHEEMRNANSITETYKVENGSIRINKNSDKWYYNFDIFKNTEKISDGGKKPEVTNKHDEWGVETFFNSIDHDGYGTTSTDLRHGLNHLCENQTVKITPGFPFIVPIFLSIVVSLTIGDIAVGWVTLISS